MVSQALAAGVKARNGWGITSAELDRRLDATSREVQKDEPISGGLRMIVLMGDGHRRTDVVGMHGQVVEKAIHKDGTVYTFVLETGEIVNSHEIWWARLPYAREHAKEAL